MCGDFSQLRYHLDNLKTSTHHPNKCAMCGIDACSKCQLCGVYLHNNPQRGEAKGKNCFIVCHDDCVFGLAKKDVSFTGTSKKDWKDPSKVKLKNNKEHIDDLKDDENE